MAGSVLLAAFVVVAPWTARNWIQFGAFIPVSTGGCLNLYQGNAPLSRGEVYNEYYANEGKVEQYLWARSAGIKAILSRTEEFRVVGEAASGPDAVQFVKRKAPAMVLMDIGLPGLNGVETTAEILRHCPDCRIVILSRYDDEE